MALASPKWESRYRLRLFITDFAIIALVVFGAQLLRFDEPGARVVLSFTNAHLVSMHYSVISALLITAWMIALSLAETRDPIILGVGSIEYKRVLNACLFAFGALAVFSYLTRAQLSRGYLLIALPIGLVALLFSRWLWRKYVHRLRSSGEFSYRTLIAGDYNKNAHVAKQVTSESYNGFLPLGYITERGNGISTPGDDTGLQVVADYDHIIEAVDRMGADTLILTSADALSPRRIREIGWDLEERGVDLILSAALTDVAGSRIHMRPVSGLPLIHVEFPRFTGRRRLAKKAFDWSLSALLLLLLSPLFLVLAVIVKLDSPGPVIFKQQRIGYRGMRFNMLKFRSMSVDAEDRLSSLLDQSDGAGVLFKMKDDPRVTRSGRWLRKYSLDELPQLFNVFRGSMSLVGPRPPLPSEVENYDEWANRRLLVKPGITGLWQVSGRSNLSWEDSVRLDLYYVENWSVMGDVLILLRTAKAVLRHEGAY